jgi:peptidoglycan/LPS O-acetylase OafA/YrhL
VLCFLASVFFYQIRERLPYSGWLFIGALLVTLVCLNYAPLFVLVPLPAAYATIWLGLQNPKKLPVIFGGGYSYGVYLYAFPIQQTWVMILGPHATFLSVLLLSLASVLLFAAFSWHVIEKPALKLKKLRLRPLSFTKSVAA